ncbi:MAG: shikimate dehydrogenase [Angustibacter sp.]
MSRRAAVLGSPIGHSLSPVLHRAAYHRLGLDEWRYDALEVADAGRLAEFLASCGPEWVGFSLTMPLKPMPLATPVAHLVDEVSARAAMTGSVNTLVCRDGGLFADNCDIDGVVRALQEAGLQEAGLLNAASNAPVVVGGGATAASAVAAFARLGARTVTAVVRDPGRAADLVGVGEQAGVAVSLARWADRPGVLASIAAAPAVVSTVPASASENAAALLDGYQMDGLGGRAEGGGRTEGGPGGGLGVLLDVVYAPWPTPLAVRWRAGGGRTVGGLVMLLHQAVAQVRLMTGRTLGAVDVAAVRRAGDQAAQAH